MYPIKKCLFDNCMYVGGPKFPRPLGTTVRCCCEAHKVMIEFEDRSEDRPFFFVGKKG
jgi:hypothetical protein